MPTRLRDIEYSCNRCDKSFITRDNTRIFCDECLKKKRERKPKVVVARKPGLFTKSKTSECKDCGAKIGFMRDWCVTCARKRYAFTIDGN